MRKLLLPLTAAVALGVAITASSALADGPCGQNYTDAFAFCPISGPGTINGTLVTNTQNFDFPGGGETDAYRFYATPGTVLSITLTDAYACNLPPVEDEAGPWALDGRCGEMLLEFPLTDTETLNSTESGYGVGPDGAVTYSLHSATLNVGPLDTGGIRELDVDGSPAFQQNNDDTTTIFPTPYTISVSVTAGSIQWPPPTDTTPPDNTPPPPPTTVPTPTPTPTATPTATPTPVTTTVPAPTTAPVKAVYCVVPRFAGQTLSTVKHRLAVNHCMAHVQRVKQSSVPRRFKRLKAGSVFALMAGKHALTPGNKLINRPSSSSVVLIQVVGPKPKLAATRSR